MKKKLIAIVGVVGLAVCCLAVAGQDLQHDVSVVNIEVPVRVFKGDNFIDNLSLKDFDLYENGILQEIDAVYLIKKTDVSREEGEKKPKLAHTLNGSALALPRIVAALLENYQTSEGIEIPEILQAYTGFDIIK